MGLCLATCTDEIVNIVEHCQYVLHSLPFRGYLINICVNVPRLLYMLTITQLSSGVLVEF